MFDFWLWALGQLAYLLFGLPVSCLITVVLSIEMDAWVCRPSHPNLKQIVLFLSCILAQSFSLLQCLLYPFTDKTLVHAIFGDLDKDETKEGGLLEEATRVNFTRLLVLVLFSSCLFS